jgi:ABC-type nitrate/sulfonate/bicarbonate transport system substrate-binding protein
VAIGWLMAMVLASTGCQRAAPTGARATRLRTAYTSAVDIGDLPSLLAGRALEAEGYLVQPTFFAQPELAVEALARGDVDIANGGTRAFWAANAKGADLVLLMEHSENGYQMVATPAVTRCADLDGRTLALSSRGALPTALGDAYLRHCPDATPRVLAIPHSGDRLSALQHGAVDATVLQRSDLTRLQQQAPGRFHSLDDFTSALPDLDLTCVFVTRHFLQTERRTVIDYLRERIRTNREVLAHPDLLFEEARRWPTMAAIDGPVAEGELRAPAWSRHGGISPKSVAATFDFFVRDASLPASLTLDQLADFSPLQEALLTLDQAARGTLPHDHQ